MRCSSGCAPGALARGACRRAATGACVLALRHPGCFDAACSPATSSSKALAARLEVGELVEARAGGRQQHDVARRGRPRAAARDGALEVAASRTARRRRARRAMRSASSPIRYTRAQRSLTASPSGAKSWPLPCPPRIRCTGARRTRASADERRGDVRRLGVVDVEDAVERRDLLEAVRDAGERARARATASRSMPRASATAAAAAIAFATLWRPRRRSSSSAISGSSSHHSAPLARQLRGGPTPKRRAGAPPGVVRGQLAREHGDVVVALAREDLELGRRGRPQRAVAVEVVGRRGSAAPPPRARSASVSSSWNDEASQTTVATGSRPRRPASVGRPDVAATADRQPRPRGGSWPISSTVVVLPFVPVTATNSLSQQAPGELELAQHRHAAPRAAATTGACARHAGALDDRARAIEQREPVRISRCSSTAGLAQRLGSRRRARRRRPITSSPRSRSASAAATPGAREADDEVRGRRGTAARDCTLSRCSAGRS